MSNQLEPLHLSPTKDTPTVNFDKDKGLFEITGRSFPLNSKGFYQPVLTWLSNYAVRPNERTEFIFKLEYFNTPSSKSITDILKILKGIKDEGKQLMVVWYYEEDDVDILDLGHVFSRIADLPFEFRDSD